ncbi:DUF1622 domain-containing protein [Croceicoccus sp. Ery5]|uniref:DUF1622 domain-containing protein n=1 Tax=Croceicoccus sp. Ery5 TaxID=1703340 RepID=UPI001E5F0BEE|nr:DUF1622 domain-containing protein [Croceicoccus sp. Ery5]
MLMEEMLNELASFSALILEAIVALLVMYGAIEAMFNLIKGGFATFSHQTRRMIWMRFAQWIILALEFALGADIIRTAIAPTWDDVGKLAAIAAIRTFLSFFLERDIEELKPEKEGAEKGSAE